MQSLYKHGLWFLPPTFCVSQMIYIELHFGRGCRFEMFEQRVNSTSFTANTLLCDVIMNQWIYGWSGCRSRTGCSDVIPVQWRSLRTYLVPVKPDWTGIEHGPDPSVTGR